jgi:hypothetical protein
MATDERAPEADRPSPSFLDIAAGTQDSPLQVLVSAVLRMLGAFLFALQFARE